MKKKILLFGGTGMLGTRIRELLSKDYGIIPPSRSEVDLFSEQSVSNFLDSNKSEYIVYAAGITNQDFAEKNKRITRKINSDIIGYIGKRAKERKIPLIYFSTDAVFSDTKKKAFDEDDSPDPINYYGKTKALGENNTLSSSLDNSVIRLISVYSSRFEKKSDFVRNAISRFMKKETYKGVTDIVFNPTFVDDAVLVLKDVIDEKVSGIFHVASTDAISNYEFMKVITKVKSFDNKLLEKINFSEFIKGKEARRAKRSVLGLKKTINLIGRRRFHTNEENIMKFFKQFR